MRETRSIPFKISGIDSLGQGVSKLTDKVTFIPKTTIGDEGEAIIMSEKKGVVFARVKTFSAKAELRIEPICEHFNSCPSCHFLHVDYKSELKFKEENFGRLFRNLPLPKIEVIEADDRLGYRNRVQLHYSLKTKLIGMKDPSTFKITPIPQCKIALKEVLDEVKRLYQNDQWLKEAPRAPMEGHVEIYARESGVQVTWNRPYADGGFTQVNQPMNDKLKKILQEEWKISSGDLLDLFGGNGNLSHGLSYSRRLCVDVYNKSMPHDFLNQDLYDKEALKKVAKAVMNEGLKIENLILDPPRSGLRNLTEWLSFFKPQKAVYVSCDPHTMARDLQNLQDYEINRAFLIDFFPSTFHFESMIFLERKS